MNQRTEKRIEGWDSKPLTRGYAELRELADGGFSGVVRTAGTTLFMLNGRVVGVFGGDIEDFASVDATAYQAPHPSLPLLFAMQEYGGEQQAKYYTNDTPISEAHDQLTDAQFTGYIELSENVLSGDYYVVYYGGRSMSCAFVGSSERLETGDDAFELADDEVGIYEVMSVDIEVTEIPDSPPGEEAGGAGAAAEEATQPTQQSRADAAEHQPAGAGPGTDSAAAGEGAADQPAERGGANRPAGNSAADPPAEHGTPDPPAENSQADSRGGNQPAESGPDGETAGAGSQPAEDAGGSQPTDPEAGDANQPPSTGTAAGQSGGVRDQGERRDTGRSTPADEPGHGPERPSDRTDEQGRGEERGAADDARADASAGDRAPERPAEGGAEGPSTADSHSNSPVDRADAGSDRPDESAGTSGGAPDTSPREEAAADRAVEAASGPSGSSATGAAAASEGVPKGEASFGDLRPVPSLSPDHTAVADPGTDDAGSGATASEPTGRQPSDDRATGDGAGSVGPDRTTSTGGTDVTERASQAVDVDVESSPATEEVSDDADVGELRQQLAVREDRIEELEAAIADLRVQRDGLTDERDRLQREVERLEGEVADLESELEQVRSRLDDGGEGTTRLSRSEALAGTNLFVRYDSKSGGTLEKAHAGDVDADEVNENLRIEHHTQFEADDVVVDGEPFERFLRASTYRGFVEWVIRDLLYEIRDTGHAKGLSELYDAIPRIDRAELLGDVSVEYTEDGEQYSEQRSFDVVLRDRMGNPLVVANLNDSRTPADREMMETVIENSLDIKGSNDSLSSAMVVTASFFKPGALEAAEEAAGGGLLGRDTKESFVRLNRKNGYHLVLVESRDGDFHVNVPEL